MSRGWAADVTTEELREAIEKGQPYMVKETNSLQEAEKLFEHKWEVALISKGLIIFRKKTEDVLVCWKIENDKQFLEEMKRRRGYSTSDLYKGKMP